MDLVLDGFDIAQRARAALLAGAPLDELYAAGVAGIANSARGDALGRARNCKFMWLRGSLALWLVAEGLGSWV